MTTEKDQKYWNRFAIKFTLGSIAYTIYFEVIAFLVVPWLESLTGSAILAEFIVPMGMLVLIPLTILGFFVQRNDNKTQAI